MAASEAVLLEQRRGWRRTMRFAAIGLLGFAALGVLWPQLSSEASSTNPGLGNPPSPTGGPSLALQASAAAQMAIAGATAELNTLRRAADVVAHGVADRRAADQSAAAKAAEDQTARDEAARQAAAAQAIEAQQPVAAPTARRMAPPTTAAAAGGQLQAASAAVDSGAEVRFFALVNDARGQAGLPALQLNSRLRTAAESWARQLATAGSLSHQGVDQFLDSWTTTGENIAFGPSVDSMFKALMASSQHYANIAKADFTSVGIGVAVGPDGKLWMSQLFAG